MIGSCQAMHAVYGLAATYQVCTMTVTWPILYITAESLHIVTEMNKLRFSCMTKKLSDGDKQSKSWQCTVHAYRVRLNMNKQHSIHIIVVGLNNNSTT